jgi:hypothetical protein
MIATAQKGHDVPPLLREAYPRHTAKRAANAAGVPLETARNWVRGRAVPSADTLLRMADVCERIAHALETRLHARRADRGHGPNAADPRGLAAPTSGTTMSKAG